MKVKCPLVQALRLCKGRTAHGGSRGIALLFHDHGTSRGWGVSVTPRPFFTPGKNPVPIVQEAGWAPGPVWTGAENLAPTGIRSPDRPARSQSLYRLSYPAHFKLHNMWITQNFNFTFCSEQSADPKPWALKTLPRKHLTLSQCILHIFRTMKVLFFLTIPQLRKKKKTITFVGRSPVEADPDFVGSQAYTILGASFKKKREYKIT